MDDTIGLASRRTDDMPTISPSKAPEHKAGNLLKTKGLKGPFFSNKAENVLKAKPVTRIHRKLKLT
jgi:hypothetical protein